MKLTVFLFTIALCIFNHLSFSSTNNNDIILEEDQQDQNIIQIDPFDINLEKQPFPFSSYHYIFETSWPKKIVYTNDIEMNYMLPDCMQPNYNLANYLTQKSCKKNYYFLQWFSTKIITPKIKSLKLDEVDTILDLCIMYKVHFFTSLDIQNEPSKKKKENLIQKALQKAKQKLENNMKKNIATFIERFNSKQPKKVILKEKNVENMMLLYQIARKIYKLHKEKFKKPSIHYQTTEDAVLETFFPHLNTLIQNIRNNPSLTTTKYDEDLD